MLGRCQEIDGCAVRASSILAWLLCFVFIAKGDARAKYSGHDNNNISERERKSVVNPAPQNATPTALLRSLPWEEATSLQNRFFPWREWKVVPQNYAKQTFVVFLWRARLREWLAQLPRVEYSSRKTSLQPLVSGERVVIAIRDHTLRALFSRSDIVPVKGFCTCARQFFLHASSQLATCVRRDLERLFTVAVARKIEPINDPLLAQSWKTRGEIETSSISWRGYK